MTTRMQRHQARRRRHEEGIQGCAWLIDAEAPAEKRNSTHGYVRKFWAASSDEAYAAAMAAGRRAVARVQAEGFSAQDRFHVACQGVFYSVTVD